MIDSIHELLEACKKMAEERMQPTEDKPKWYRNLTAVRGKYYGEGR
jgi:hypothetical protein